MDLITQLNRSSWWAKILGLFRRHWNDYQDWRRARLARVEKARLANIPVFKVAIVGYTNWVDDAGKALYKEQTHAWHLYETPKGKRSIQFYRKRPRYKSADDEGSDHYSFHSIITPWLNGHWNCAYEKTAEMNGEPWGWRKKAKA